MSGRMHVDDLQEPSPPHALRSTSPCAAKTVTLKSVAGMMMISCLASFCGPALAQGFPSRPIRMIVPFPPGGATDVVARAVAGKLSISLGQQVIADNRPGASSVIGTEIASRADPDGHTLLVCALTHVTNPSLARSLPYDTLRVFTPITLLARSSSLLLVNSKVQARSVGDLVALSRSKPGTMNYASAGDGTAAHLGMELFKLASKIDAAHVRYKGAGPQLAALISGEVDLAFLTTSTAKPHVESGRLVALALAADARAKGFSSVPTLAEVGLPSIDFYAWSGLLAPANTPAPVIRRLNQEVNAALQSPDVLKQFDLAGIESTPGTPGAMSIYLASEITKWAKVIRDARIAVQ